MVPTDAGERLLEASKAILQICNTIKGELETIARPKLLRIGILQSLSSRRVSRLLGSFRLANPSVAIEMFDGVGEQLLGLLADRRVDTILTIFDDNSASKFPSRVLFNEPYVLAVPDGHRFAQRRSVKLSDLRGEPFIVRARCDRYHDVSDALESRGVTLKVMQDRSRRQGAGSCRSRSRPCAFPRPLRDAGRKESGGVRLGPF